LNLKHCPGKTISSLLGSWENVIDCRRARLIEAGERCTENSVFALETQFNDLMSIFYSKIRLDIELNVSLYNIHIRNIWYRSWSSKR